LISAVEEALQFSRSGRVIVEEYIEGPEFSLDAIVYQGEVTLCGIADRHIFFPPYFIEMGHTMPAALPPETRELVADTFRAGIRALGITLGAAKGDIKLSPRGPMIGEIAARLSGGYMSGWTYPYAAGVEPAAGAIRVCMGKEPGDLQPRKAWTSAERAFISIPGRIGSIEGIPEARLLPLIKNLFLRVKTGDRVRFPENNVGKCGNVISAAPCREAAVAAAEGAARSILIRLAVPDGETGRFLAASPAPAPSFPPDAFTLPPALYARLAALPDPEPGVRPIGRELCLLDFPEFLSLEIQDYAGRGPRESLDAVRRLTGLPLPLCSPLPGTEIQDRTVLGRRFWEALLRGGYQGGAYLVDLTVKTGRDGDAP
jgi:hypothetical protein